MEEKKHMEIKKEFPHINFLENEPMSRHTTFRVGGPAGLFASVAIEDLSQLMTYCKEHQIPVTILGNGSNVLVADAGIDGLVISLGKEASAIQVEGACITVEAGALLSQVANAALEQGLGGLAFAAGIPGTIGGAVYMNAGAYGGEMKDVIQWVDVLLADGTQERWSAEQLDLSYRHSRMMEEQAIVLRTMLKLHPQDAKKIKAEMDNYRARRQEKQPLEYPSAGSTFKRPEGYFAGKLIMDAGLAGYRVGDAAVSKKHCGFVVNLGQATASDIRQLMQDVSDCVYDKFGVTLEPEVRFVGRF